MFVEALKTKVNICLCLSNTMRHNSQGSFRWAHFFGNGMFQWTVEVPNLGMLSHKRSTLNCSRETAITVVDNCTSFYSFKDVANPDNIMTITRLLLLLLLRGMAAFVGCSTFLSSQWWWGRGGVVMVRGESVFVEWSDDGFVVRGGVLGEEEAMVGPLSKLGKPNDSTDIVETNHWQSKLRQKLWDKK